jgi:hypothetical protein
MHVIEIPIMPELAKIIAASPCGDLTFSVTERGKPFYRERIWQLVPRPF